LFHSFSRLLIAVAIGGYNGRILLLLDAGATGVFLCRSGFRKRRLEYLAVSTDDDLAAIRSDIRAVYRRALIASSR